MASVKGLANLNRKLTELGRSMHRGSEAGQEEVIEDLAEDWRREAPVDRGTHRAGIVETEDGVAATADHSVYVEYGTRTHAAHADGRSAAARAATKAAATVALAVKRRLPR